ncbi:YafY family transcriptional regulator [Mumia sp. zg.B53]|uniref:helix-turn-helix transcriptional regulator n=1 Tax=unclassified Mumia TaxID=2621872 RepID=UPI001C6E558A|nr:MULTISPECIES: YafY family protein [unclassified Mumia]MBW9210325.1 YafY family transcriptional regulator [Mumia sp. zg.B21]MBW9214941.1 YafY family transcriptional regulator [Mumia sp. zg.B53]
MAGSSERMLRLLSLLQTHRYWTGPELAGRLDVSERTLRRDVERLRGLGYPVDATRGAAGGYQLQAGASLPPLLVADDEAVAIAVGLQASAGTGTSAFDDAAVRALSKIVQVMPPRLRRRVKALQDYTDRGPMYGPSTDAVLLSVLAQTCRDDERLEIVYHRADGERSRRTVEPHRLVSRGRRWYLVAYDLQRGDWRTFRVDRMSEPRATGVRFRQRELPAPDAATFVSEKIAALRPTTDVSFVVRAPAEKVADVVRWWGTVEPDGDERCRVTMSVDTLDWVVFVLAAVGAPYEQAEPAALAEHLRRTGEMLAGSR